MFIFIEFISISKSQKKIDKININHVNEVFIEIISSHLKSLGPGKLIKRKYNFAILQAVNDIF